MVIQLAIKESWVCFILSNIYSNKSYLSSTSNVVEVTASPFISYQPRKNLVANWRLPGTLVYLVTK